jgi:hypothetical protein
MLRGALIACGCLALVGQAWAAPAKLQDFFGEWIGSGKAKQGAAVQTRDATVTIERLADGFKITWSTLRSKDDTPTASVVKSTTLRFKGTADPTVFHAMDNADPVNGGRAAWAVLKDATLRIQLFQVGANGDWTIQTYDRTLTGPSAMTVSYRQTNNGEAGRNADLKLTKSP